MPSKRNGVLESDSEKKRQRQTNSGLTADNLNLAHLLSIGLWGWKGALTTNHPMEKTAPSISWLIL
jgi:hypothetical protein